MLSTANLSKFLARRAISDSLTTSSTVARALLAASVFVLVGFVGAVIHFWVTRRYIVRHQQLLDVEAQEIKIAQLLGIPVSCITESHLRQNGVSTRLPPHILFAHILNPKPGRQRTQAFFTRPSPLRQVLNAGDGIEIQNETVIRPPGLRTFLLKPCVSSLVPTTPQTLGVWPKLTAEDAPVSKPSPKRKTRAILAFADINSAALSEPEAHSKGQKGAKITRDFSPPYQHLYRWGTAAHFVAPPHRKRHSRNVATHGKEN